MRVAGTVVTRLKEYVAHLARAGDLMAQFLVALAGSRVLEFSGPVLNPTTPSTQATGAAGALAWRVNMPWLMVCINGSTLEKAATADFSVFAAASPVPNGSAATAALVAYQATNGSIQVIPVLGTTTVGTTAPGPTDAVIDAAVKVANAAASADWVKLAETTFARTGDINTFTQAHNMTKADMGPTLSVPASLK